MAERRMFSKRIVSSARFLKMPSSTQCLYFHLGLHADDDGVVEAYTVINSIAATEDDLRVLVANGFVTILNEDLVSYITDWTENNRIRADRKIDSIYKDLLLQVLPDVELRQRVPRADTKKLTGQPMDNQWTTNGQPMDGIGKDRLGKDRLGKDRLGKDSKVTKRFKAPTLEEVADYCKERNNNIDAEAFYDYYTTQGWVLSNGQKMKDWKSAVRNWERRDKNKKPQQEKDDFDWEGIWD